MSLRDVERAMVVFKFFIEKMSVQGSPCQANDEVMGRISLFMVTVSLSVTLSLSLSCQDDKT